MARLTVPGVQENVQGVPDRPQGADAAAFGGIDAASSGRAAEAQMRTNEQFVAIAADMNEKQATQDTLDASTAIKEYTNGRVAEIRKLQGKDAEGVAAREAEAFGKYRDKIGGKLNARARLAFENQAHATGQQFAEHAAKHEFTEGEKAFDQSNTAMLNADLNAVGANPGDIGVLDVAKQNVKNVTKIMAQRRGWTPEYAEQYQKERVSMLHQSTIETMVDSGKYSDAAAYYKTFQKEVVGHKQKDMEKLLKEGNVRQTAQEFADGWSDTFAKTTLAANDERNIDHTYALAEKALRAEIKDPYKRAAAQAELKHLYDGQKRLLEANMTANTRAGIAAFDAGGGRTSAIPPTVAASMNPETLHVLRRQEQTGVNREEHRGDDAAVQREETKYLDATEKGLTYRFDVNSPDAQRMNPTQRARFVNISAGQVRREIKPDDPPKAHELDVYYDMLGWNNATRNTPAGAHEVNKFGEAATNAMHDARKAKKDGQPLTPQERKEVFAKLVLEGYTKEGNFLTGTKKRGYEVWNTPERERWFTPDELKDNEGITKAITEIDEALKRDNLAPTKANRIAEYQNMKKRRKEAAVAAPPPARNQQRSPEEQ